MKILVVVTAWVLLVAACGTDGDDPRRDGGDGALDGAITDVAAADASRADAQTICAPPTNCTYQVDCPPNGPYAQICYSTGGDCSGCTGKCGFRCYSSGDCPGLTSDHLCCGASGTRPGVCAEEYLCATEQVCPLVAP